MSHFGQILPMTISFFRENNPMNHLEKDPHKTIFTLILILEKP